MNGRIDIRDFLTLSAQHPIVDVRSPGEFEKGHIPGAYNIPLFDNEERAIIGTAYKRQGRDMAVEIGYEIVKPKLNDYLKEVSKLNAKSLLVQCWRGGMRSEKFAEFLRENGYEVSVLIRGYKAYRNRVLKEFEHLPEMVLLGGETGSGKTEILHQIAREGHAVIDLEGIAHHKGSAFGALGQREQPSQEQFENNLIRAIEQVRNSNVPVWVEDESRTIGTCWLPAPFWNKMKASPIIRVQIPFEDRVGRLVREYGTFPSHYLAESIQKIHKRLGPQHAKRALEELEAGNLAEVTRIVLKYYDKAYNYCHELRDFRDVHFIECPSADYFENAQRVLRAMGELVEHGHA